MFQAFFDNDCKIVSIYEIINKKQGERSIFSHIQLLSAFLPYIVALKCIVTLHNENCIGNYVNQF